MEICVLANIIFTVVSFSNLQELIIEKERRRVAAREGDWTRERIKERDRQRPGPVEDTVTVKATRQL